jgi:hypothetical protein
MKPAPGPEEGGPDSMFQELGASTARMGIWEVGVSWRFGGPVGSVELEVGVD